MKKREDRRDRTIRYGERTRDVHLRMIHPTGPVDCICEFSAWKFAKGKSNGCGCRRTRKGQPKLVVSMCHGGGGYHPTVTERIEGRRLCHSWVRWVADHEPDEFND